MSTRSMTVLSSKNGVDLNLYRHLDGYPAVAGKDLADTLSQVKGSTADLARALLAVCSSSGRACYELTGTKPEHHGDLEHVYAVVADLDGEGCFVSWVIYHFERSLWSPRKGSTEYFNWPSKRYTLDAFLELTNQQADAMSKREALLATRA